MNSEKIDAQQEIDRIVKWIQDWFAENGPKANAVIGISGGKDSSIVAALLCRALGKERVVGVLMPNGEQKDIETVTVKGQKIWLRIDGDFLPDRDIAKCYYSTDGKRWTPIGGDYKMVFDYRKLFMGTRYAIFCYATKKQGGWLDVDSFTMTPFN